MKEIKEKYMVGDLVKIRKPGERFFVKIVRITKTKYYVKVANRLIIYPYKYGQIITIHPDEILYKE